jgi:hypothetical protein
MLTDVWGLLKVFSLTMTEGLVVMHVLAGHRCSVYLLY